MTRLWFQSIWKNISQIGSLPQVEVNIKKTFWNHHLDKYPTTKLIVPSIG